MIEIENEELVPPPRAAAFLHKTPRTLANWRCSRRFNLPFVRVGGRIFYRRADLEDFIRRGRVDPAASERGRDAKVAGQIG